MNKQDFFIKGIAGLVALVAVAGIAGTSFAFNGAGDGPPDGVNTPARGQKISGMTEEARAEWRENREERKAEAEQRREVVMSALEDEDYDAWSKAVGENHPMAEKINKDNFSRLVEVHELRQEAGDIMEEIGIERGPGVGHKAGHPGKGSFGCMR
ncbi:MAG: hypothetical protein ACOCVY_02075 [Patescibacteria group bacterium]